MTTATATQEVNWDEVFGLGEFTQPEPTAAEKAAAKKAREQKQLAYQAELAGLKVAGKVWKQCPKCHGHGRLEQYQHIAGGKCYKCGGAGVC